MTTRTQSVPRAVADLEAGTILATVEIAAPPERVFQALTTGDELVRWWGSDDLYRTTRWVVDLRPGGAWRAEGKGRDGKPFTVGGSILEVDRPRKLVQSWKADWDGGNETTITFRFDAIDGGTRLTLRHEGFAGRPQSCEGHSNGWQRVLRWLAGYASASGGDSGKYFLCRLIPPRPTFPFDMSEKEREAMNKHAAYWKELAASGTALAFGPVGDPKGAWGVGIVVVGDESELKSLQNEDPAIRAAIGMRYEAHPMLSLVLGSP